MRGVACEGDALVDRVRFLGLGSIVVMGCRVRS